MNATPFPLVSLNSLAPNINKVMSPKIWKNLSLQLSKGNKENEANFDELNPSSTELNLLQQENLVPLVHWVWT